MSRRTGRGPFMSERPIRLGFVGAGRNTRDRHIPGFQKQPGVEFVAVANRSRESGERVAKQFGIRRVENDWRAVMAAPDVDAVCIGTWPYTHCEMTVAALAAGKHVLCEARMAMNAAEGRRMLEASRRAPRLVAQLVPSPPTLEVDSTLKVLLAEGYVGEVLVVELSATRLREFPIPAERRVGWRVEEEFVNAVRGREKVSHTTFEDGVRYMEFTDAVAQSLALGRVVDVADL